MIQSQYTHVKIASGNLWKVLVALRDHFTNPNLTELRMIELKSARFDAKTMRPDQFLVKLERLAKQALPDPMPLPVGPAEAAIGQADIDRAAREKAANDERQRFATQERDHLGGLRL